jgi:hypothetical protein
MSFDKILVLPLVRGGLVKLITGGILEMIPVANIFAAGYILECYRNGAYQREAMPEWTGWGAKFVNGLMIIIIGFLYLIIPLLFLGLSGAPGNPYYAAYHMGAGAFLVFALLFILFTFILPMAIAHFAVNRNFLSAFQLGYIFRLIGSSPGSYIGAYLLYFLASIICLVLVMIPLIGWLFALFAGFYLSCVAGFLFGAVYHKAAYLVSGYKFLKEE